MAGDNRAKRASIVVKLMRRIAVAHTVAIEQFAQVHRSVVVNLRAISQVKRHDNETAEVI